MVHHYCEACGKHLKSASDLCTRQSDFDADILRRKYGISEIASSAKVCGH